MCVHACGGTPGGRKLCNVRCSQASSHSLLPKKLQQNRLQAEDWRTLEVKQKKLHWKKGGCCWHTCKLQGTCGQSCSCWAHTVARGDSGRKPQLRNAACCPCTGPWSRGVGRLGQPPLLSSVIPTGDPATPPSEGGHRAVGYA